MYFEALQRTIAENNEKESKKRIEQKKPLVYCNGCGWHAVCECNTFHCHFGHVPTDAEIAVCGYGDKIAADKCTVKPKQA